MKIPFGRLARAVRMRRGPQQLPLDFGPGASRIARSSRLASIGKSILRNRAVQTIGAAAGTAGLMDVVMTGGGVAAANQLSARRDRRLQRQINELRRQRGY